MSAASFAAGGPLGRRGIVGLAVLSFVTGAVLMTVVQQRPSAAPAAPSTARSVSSVESETGPTSSKRGIPSGFARTSDGAVAAAVAYVRSGQALLDMDLLAAEEAVRDMSAEGSADRIAKQTVDQLRAAHEALAGGTGPIVFRQAAIAYRVEAFDSDRARVAVWNVGVLTRAGVASPQAGWATSTFDLVWERGDWRIWAESIVPGPAPVLNDSTAPATAEELVSSLDGFADLGAVE